MASALPRAIHALPGCDFWPDSLSYADAGLDHARGHRQVTDAYLASVVADRPDSMPATLDDGLARDLPELTTLVPLSLVPQPR